MNNEKLDNILNLALNATPLEREKSDELDVGYNQTQRTWQVIVKSSAGFVFLEELYPEVKVQTLLNGYAVLTIPQNLIDEISERPEIEYMEKPKRLFFAVNEGRRASCVTPLQSMAGIPFIPGNAPEGLFGKDIVVAIIDSGIDYAHPDFRNEDGSTRIVALWDQTLDRIYDSSQINEALEQSTEAERYSIVPSRDLSGHGTHVAGIACGNGRASGGVYRGVASQAEILVVKLGIPEEGGFPRTTELMLGVDYVLRKARELEKPVAINLSFGTNQGSHEGTSLVETYLNDVSSYWKNVIVVGTGNEGDGRIHTSGKFDAEGLGNETMIFQFSVGEFETSLNLQLWKSYVDEMEIRLRYPDGTIIGPLPPVQGTQRYSAPGTEILIYYGEPRPYSVQQEIYFDFLPSDTYIRSGIWEIMITSGNIVDGYFDLWLPGQGSLSLGTGFLNPTENLTITIPSTADGVISVGAYNTIFDTYAPFSGRGYINDEVFIKKPDLVAPGVNITSCAPGGGYTSKSGTSMAAPFVTGAAALLMEWGIVLENDVYLFGEKVRAYLQRGARMLPGFSPSWNPTVGYGALCVSDSLPEK